MNVCQSADCPNLHWAEEMPVKHTIRAGCPAAPSAIELDLRVRPRPLRNDPVEVNPDGGSQSVIEHTFTTLPLTALSLVSQLQRLGDQKYGAHNWRLIPERDHIDHAFMHLLGHCTGDQTEDHLLHAAWRLLAAVEVRATRSTAYEEENDD